MIFRHFLAFISICTFAISTLSDARKFLAVSESCGIGSEPCGYTSCCSSGFRCSFVRGIPVCFNPNETGVSGFGHIPCADPYTSKSSTNNLAIVYGDQNSCKLIVRCDDLLGVDSGSCCPIGSICGSRGTSQTVECVNAFGETQSSIPSSATGFVPSATSVTNNVVFSPSHAWTMLPNGHDCTNSKTLFTTNSTNATASLNYTGPSIMVNAITSPNGGAFSVIVDGFDTGSKIDTYVASGNPFPTCFPNQFPPFMTSPPDFGSKENHTVTLKFIGASQEAQEGTESNIQFDSFAVPNHDDTSRLGSSGRCIFTGWMGVQAVLPLTVLVVFSSIVQLV